MYNVIHSKVKRTSPTSPVLETWLKANLNNPSNVNKSVEVISSQAFITPLYFTHIITTKKIV